MNRMTLGACAVATAASVAVFPWLPERVPVHFDLSGTPDNFAPRAIGAFVLPAFMLVAWLIARASNAGAAKLVSAFVAWFFLALHVLVLRAALTGGGLGGGMWLVMGVFFVAVGLVLPRVRRNRWVGVRTPWSMSSPEAWARSQRGGGYAMIAAGALITLSAMFTGAPAIALRALAIFGAAVVSIAYSWWSSKTSVT